MYSKGMPPPQPRGRPQGSHPLVLTAPALTKTRNSSSFFVVFVRAGVAWCGVGTLAVLTRVGFLSHFFPFAPARTTRRLASAAFHPLAFPLFTLLLQLGRRQLASGRKVLWPRLRP